MIDDSDPALHESVGERHRKPPITAGPYRRTRTLVPGQFAAVRVSARDPWSWTSLYLVPGDYAFEASGRWADRSIEPGPAGITDWNRFRPSALPQLLGTVLGRGEQLFRRRSENPMANFPLSRRDETMPWMSLVGVVANDAIQLKGDQALHERVAIGAGTKHTVRRADYLYAFANDAWGFYGDNRGSVQLTVTRTA